MNVGDILGREVLDLSTATTVGCVVDVVIDPVSRRVVAFRLGRTATSRAWLPFGNVTTVGADVLTVTDDVQLLELPGEVACGAESMTLGGRVLTDQGREIGPLQDIDIDDDGSITALITAAGPIAADDLIGIGSYAVVVTDHNDAP